MIHNLKTIFFLSKIDYRLRYHENTLGILWALIRPAMEVIVYYFAFRYFLGKEDSYFLPYLFLGQISWLLFSELSLGAITILETKKYLYEYSSLTKPYIYFAYCLTILRGFFFNLLIFLGLLLILGIPISISIFYFPLVLISSIFGFVGIGMILSIIYLYFRDIVQMYTIFIFCLYWATPIILPTEMYLNKAPYLPYLNPVFGWIYNLRSIFLYQESPNLYYIFSNALWSIFLLGLGFFLIQNSGKKASELL